VKIKLLAIILKEIRAKATSAEFKRIEDVVLDVAESAGDPKTVAAAKMLRMILDARD
jgi:hypothetical protein